MSWVELGLVQVVLLFLILGCDPFRTRFEDGENAVMYTADRIKAPPEQADTITVMTWNIKFAGGRIDFFYDCYGNRTLMKKSEVLSNLEGLAEKINQVDPDILLLQEVDIESKRCAYVDNLQWLLNNTDLNYGAYASQWKADYVPSDGLGRVNSGNAVLSRWRIHGAVRLALPLISEQDAFTRYFYLRRNILKARIALPGVDDLHVLCIHTSAFSHDGTKKKQIDRMKLEMDDLDSRDVTVVAGGDFNAIPPGAARVQDFPDSKCEDEKYEADDYSDETDWMEGFFTDYDAAVPLPAYLADEERYFTHTTDKDGFWNRKLDYLFTNRDFVPGSGMVHQDRSSGGMETMPLSDHAPVTVRMVIQ